MALIQGKIYLHTHTGSAIYKHTNTTPVVSLTHPLLVVSLASVVVICVFKNGCCIYQLQCRGTFRSVIYVCFVAILSFDTASHWRSICNIIFVPDFLHLNNVFQSNCLMYVVLISFYNSFHIDLQHVSFARTY